MRSIGSACPLILFQGLEDRVVPPSQTQLMADALRRKGLSVAVLLFEGEPHGFRRAERSDAPWKPSSTSMASSSGFTPAGSLEPVDDRECLDVERCRETRNGSAALTTPFVW